MQGVVSIYWATNGVTYARSSRSPSTVSFTNMSKFFPVPRVARAGTTANSGDTVEWSKYSRAQNLNKVTNYILEITECRVTNYMLEIYRMHI